MAVVSVREIWDGRNASLDEAGERTYSRHFRVITDSMLTAQISVGNAPGIPRRFDFYVDPDGYADTGALCRKVTVDQTEDPFVWLVHAEYASKLSVEPSRGAEEPLDRPAEVEWGQTKFTRPLERDAIDDSPLVNKAGDPFDPVPEVEECRLTLKITRNQLAYSPLVALTYTNTTNKTAWLGFGSNAAKCTGITAKRAYEKGLYYWVVTYEFEFQLDGWRMLVLNQGYRELNDDGERVRIIENGMVPAAPSLLDDEGRRLDRDAQPTYVLVDAYKESDFNLLLLP